VLEGSFRAGLLIGALAVGVVALGVAVVVLITGDDEGASETTTVVSTVSTTVTATATDSEDAADPSPPASADCGDVAEGGTGVYNVEAENLECVEATRVAHAWERDCLGPPGACSAAGFQCESVANGERSDVTCRNDPGEVRFAFASFDPP
jgi:hypothetical protein